VLTQIFPDEFDAVVVSSLFSFPTANKVKVPRATKELYLG